MQNRLHGRQSKWVLQDQLAAFEAAQVRVTVAWILVEAEEMQRIRIERINYWEVMICPVNVLVFILSF